MSKSFSMWPISSLQTSATLSPSSHLPLNSSKTYLCAANSLSWFTSNPFTSTPSIFMSSAPA